MPASGEICVRTRPSRLAPIWKSPGSGPSNALVSTASTWAIGAAAYADQDALGVVEDFARQRQFMRLEPDEGAKTDALHAAAHADFPGGDGGGEGDVHAASHNRMRLLPESATTRVSPQALTL